MVNYADETIQLENRLLEINDMENKLLADVKDAFSSFILKVSFFNKSASEYLFIITCAIVTLFFTNDPIVTACALMFYAIGLAITSYTAYEIASMKLELLSSTEWHIHTKRSILSGDSRAFLGALDFAGEDDKANLLARTQRVNEKVTSSIGKRECDAYNNLLIVSYGVVWVFIIGILGVALCFYYGLISV